MLDAISWKLTLPFLRGSVHQIQGCPLGHLGVRSSNLYPQSVSSKGWKPALLGIRVERPVTEVPWISAQVWLVFPPKSGRGLNFSSVGIGMTKAPFLVVGTGTIWSLHLPAFSSALQGRIGTILAGLCIPCMWLIYSAVSCCPVFCYPGNIFKQGFWFTCCPREPLWSLIKHDQTPTS